MGLLLKLGLKLQKQFTFWDFISLKTYTRICHVTFHWCKMFQTGPWTRWEPDMIIVGARCRKKNVCLHLVDILKMTGKRLSFNNKRFINNVKWLLSALTTVPSLCPKHWSLSIISKPHAADPLSALTATEWDRLYIPTNWFLTSSFHWK